uniref:Uncharacterized protein LOC101506985 n=1 Tax=Rhizophora mucronata TaxID=61149 RepID=A0A2P2PCT2_RHIMU
MACNLPTQQLALTGQPNASTNGKSSLFVSR